AKSLDLRAGTGRASPLRRRAGVSRSATLTRGGPMRGRGGTTVPRPPRQPAGRLDLGAWVESVLPRPDHTPSEPFKQGVIRRPTPPRPADRSDQTDQQRRPGTFDLT